jgi:SAM-dependent methyltransferase
MMEFVSTLRPGARVLDLGSGSGSGRVCRNDITVFRLDLKPPRTKEAAGQWIVADAALLPFESGSFDVVISSHSLEHMDRLAEAVAEVGRVLKADGTLHVIVPDSTTLTDRIYRWLGRGGGHVNSFRRQGDVISLVESTAGLRCRRCVTLLSSLSFLNARNLTPPLQKKMLLFASGNERFLTWFVWLLRWLDRLFGSRLSVYGWRYSFSSADSHNIERTRVNVCVRCGSGNSEAFLRALGRTGKSALMETYRCPACGAVNFLFRDPPPRQ